MADFEVSGLITLDDSQLKNGIENAKSGFSNMGSNIRSAGVGITKFGVGASLALAPVTLFLKSSVSAFREFDVAMTNSQTILGATSEEMEILSAQVLEIGANTGLGPQAVADSFFTVVSGVADATTHMDILQQSVTLAEAGLADLSVTTDGMVAVMNAYQFAAEDASFVSDVFTRTVQSGVGTMDEFVAALAPLASLSKTLGIGFEDLAASEAFLTTQGQSASAAATELSAIMTAFIKPSQGMTDALNAMGVESGLALIQAEGLQGAVDILSASLGDDAIALGEVFTRAEALKGALILAGDGAEEFGVAFEDGMDGASQAAADLQNATDAAIGDAFTSKMTTLKILVGEGLSGAFADAQTAAMPFIEDMIAWAQQNPETVEQLILGAAALVALAGGLVIAGAAVSAFGLLLSPAAVFIVGIAGAIFLLDELAKAFGLDGAVDAFQTALVAAEQLGQIFALGMELIFGGVVTVIRDAMATAGQIVEIAVAAMLGLIEGVITAIQTASDVASDIAGAPGTAADVAGGLFSQIGTIGRNILGFADGGSFDAFQPITVGERGPETVVFPQAGNVIANGQSGGGMFDGATFIVQASGEAEGRAAGRGLKMELESIMTRNG